MTEHEYFRIWVDENGFLQANYSNTGEDFSGKLAGRVHMETIYEALTYGQALLNVMIPDLKKRIS